MTTDYQQRVKNVKHELDTKRQKLIDFMHTDNYAKLIPVEQGLLMVQLVAMNNYSDVLGRRIELL